MPNWGKRMKRLVAFLLLISVAFTLIGAEPTIAVVLSGGGARGIAHIAVLQALEEAGIPIDLVIGTSMGSLVGGLYSAGYTPREIEKILEETDLSGLFMEPPLDSGRKQETVFTYNHDHVFTLSFGKKGIGDAPALIGDQKILELLGFLFSKYPNTLDFDQLPIPFRCVSADAVTAEAIVHDCGSLVRAIRSSISIPIVFAPFPQQGGKLAVDGGVVDNLPIALARSMGADIVIASDVNALQVQDYQQLESLSAMVMQTIILVTQKAATEQHSQADLVFFPELQDIFALDFGKYATILERGKASVLEKQEELGALIQRIAQERALEYKDKDRIGSYQLLPVPSILQLSLEDLSLHPGQQLPPVSQFSHFLGRRLDKQTANELNLKLREVRKENDLSFLAYEMGEQGNLVLLSRGFGRSDASISMGLQVDTGFSNALPASVSWYRADVFLDASFERMVKPLFTFVVKASVGHRTGMDIGFTHPFSVSRWAFMDVGLLLSYGSGNLSVLNAVVNADRQAPLDRAFHADFILGFRFHETAKASLVGRYNLISLNDDRYEQRLLSYPQLTATLLYNSMEGRFSSRGSRFDFLASFGFLETWHYDVRIGWREYVPLSYQDSVGYDLQLSHRRMPYSLIDSYVDIGGVDGIGGYSPLSFVRDVILLGFSWQHRLSEIFGYPAYGKVCLRGGVYEQFDPYTGVEGPNDPFLATRVWDFGLSLLMGLETPLGEALVGLGTSLKGNVTVTVGIY